MSANYANGTIGYDLTFELNEFGQPRIRSEIETVKDVLMTVLFLKPGDYPSIPELGIGVDGFLYTEYDRINCDDLKRSIIEQCAMLHAYIENSAIQVQKLVYKGKPSLVIRVNGTERYPSSYLHDNIGVSDQYNIGITYDEMNQMIYNVREG